MAREIHHHQKPSASPCDTMFSIPTITIDELIARYEVLLLDAYGVLVDRDGALPGAVELIAHLNRTGKAYYLVTNTAARPPEHSSGRYLGFGLDIPAERILTSGMLLEPYFRANDLAGRRCAVLGPVGSAGYVEQAGGIVVSADEDFEILVVGDQAGFPFVETVDAVLSGLIARLDRGGQAIMILPNPDLVYPSRRGFGITSGSIALIIETVLRQRYPGRADLAFVPLGKPEIGLFEKAARRSGTRDMVMIGDQPDTDIRGARAFGIDSALVLGGVGSPAAATESSRPTYLLQSIAPAA